MTHDDPKKQGNAPSGAQLLGASAGMEQHLKKVASEHSANLEYTSPGIDLDEDFELDIFPTSSKYLEMSSSS